MVVEAGGRRSCSPHGIQEAERQKGAKDKTYPQKCTTTDLLPPTKLQLLIVHSAMNLLIDEYIDEINTS
jgi:hypothetical protein